GFMDSIAAGHARLATCQTGNYRIGTFTRSDQSGLSRRTKGREASKGFFGSGIPIFRPLVLARIFNPIVLLCHLSGLCGYFFALLADFAFI
ncbi:MAG: hypothetical protein AB7H86_13565, partial [Blastocatellales bacterium]